MYTVKITKGGLALYFVAENLFFKTSNHHKTDGPELLVFIEPNKRTRSPALAKNICFMLHRHRKCFRK